MPHYTLKHARKLFSDIPACYVSSLLPSLRLLFPSLPHPRKYVLSILIKLQLRDHDLAWMNPDRYTLPIGLLARDALDVDDVFEAVDGGDGAFAAFVGAAHDGDFVVLADWDRADLKGVGC